MRLTEEGLLAIKELVASAQEAAEAPQLDGELSKDLSDAAHWVEELFDLDEDEY